MFKLFFLQSFLESGPMSDLTSKFISGIPKVVMAIVILIVGLLICKLIAKMVKSFLEKIQIDRLGDKLSEIDIVDKSNIKIKFSVFLSKIVYYFMFIFVLVIAADVLQMQAVTDIVSDLLNLIPNIIVALAILVIGTLFAEAVKNMVKTALDSLGIPSAKLISTFLFYFLFINIALTALKQAKIDTGFLQQNISLLIGGVVLAFALGYGYASRSTMSNFLASYYTQGKIKVGDRITLEGTTGDIVALDKSTMMIKTDTNNTVIFPLHKVTKEKIELHN